MKKKLLMLIATVFYHLHNFVVRFDKTPYFMHQTRRYIFVRWLGRITLNTSNQVLNIATTTKQDKIRRKLYEDNYKSNNSSIRSL